MIPACGEIPYHILGREPDDRPMGGLIQWRNVAGANIQIFHDKENGGSRAENGSCKSLEEIGVKLTVELEGDDGRIAQLADPDGNRITLAEPPSRPLNIDSTGDPAGEVKSM
ncbi:hypothetical protein REMIM1_PF00944 (plasmid) [Rhizobium etli bv. mimosae str. Mim1]|nr:hypothetical protein REMIM1_PF00944 [Rhizobium etli bv. mimosae str. Mim1]